MFRPHRPLFLLAALSMPFSGCSTAYTRMYSTAKSYYKAPAEKPTTKEDADKLLGPGTPGPGMPPGTPPGELPPAPPGPLPGAEPPAADPLNMQPMVPGVEPAPGAMPPAAPPPP
jgi:hypothetical protein